MSRATTGPRRTSLAGAPFRKLLAALVVVVASAWTSEASAELPPNPGSIQGGAVEIDGRGALTLGMGWPSTYVRWDFRATSSFGIGLQADFYYGMPSFGFNYSLGTGFSVPMRINVFNQERWTVAVSIRPGFYLGWGAAWHDAWNRNLECGIWGGDFFYAGILLEPGVRVGFQAVDFLNVVFGADLGVHIIVASPAGHETIVEPFIPLTAMAGVELALSQSVQLFFYTHVGPALGSAYVCTHCDNRGVCDRWRSDFRAAFAGKVYLGFNFFF